MYAAATLSIVLVLYVADEVIINQKRKDLRRKYRQYEEYQALTLLSDHNDIVWLIRNYRVKNRLLIRNYWVQFSSHLIRNYLVQYRYTSQKAYLGYEIGLCFSTL